MMSYTGVLIMTWLGFSGHGQYLTVSITYTLGTHSLTVLSLEAEAIKCPDGENVTESTAS